MAEKRYFGTDGIRGHVGQGAIVPDVAIRLGYAAGRVLGANLTQPRVFIGKDTRRSCYMLESALQAGLTAAGVDVYLVGPMPTPGVAYLTRAFRACAGVVISASHNLHQDNGIKFFTAQGEKLCDRLELEIEAMMETPCEVVPPESIGKVFHLHDAPGRYVEFCKASLPPFSNLQGLKMVLDCANGATYHIAPKVMDELGADVVTLGTTPDGLNINMGCGSTAPKQLADQVVAISADIGIAFDGDGDRVIMVDHEGTVVDGDEILYILAQHAKQAGLLGNGGVVGTQMSNLGLAHALARSGIPFVRSKVGDRHVMALLREKNWYLGGESSGHIIWLNSTTTGDGVVAALQVLHIMRETGRSLRALLSDMEKYPQVLHNIALQETISDQQWHLIHEKQKVLEAEMGGDGRILIRPSGTEPLLRVMVESDRHEMTRQCCDTMVAAVTAILEGESA